MTLRPRLQMHLRLMPQHLPMLLPLRQMLPQLLQLKPLRPTLPLRPRKLPLQMLPQPHRLKLPLPKPHPPTLLPLRQKLRRLMLLPLLQLKPLRPHRLKLLPAKLLQTAPPLPIQAARAVRPSKATRSMSRQCSPTPSRTAMPASRMAWAA